MQVNVTVSDLAHGFTRPRECPLWHAITRAAHTQDVQVGIFNVWINGRPHPLPQDVSRWLLSSIAGIRSRPITFDL